MKLTRNLFAIAVIFILASCGNEDCYDCTHDDPGIASYTLCEDEAGSKAALEEAISAAVDFGGYVCIKQ